MPRRTPLANWLLGRLEGGSTTSPKRRCEREDSNLQGHQWPTSISGWRVYLLRHVRVVPGAGFEPARPQGTPVSETGASTSFATRAVVEHQGIEPCAGCISDIQGHQTVALRCEEGRDRTDDLLFVRQPLLPAELLPRGRAGRIRTGSPVVPNDVPYQIRPLLGWGGRSRTLIRRFKAGRPAVGRHPSRCGENRTLDARLMRPACHHGAQREAGAGFKPACSRL